MRAALVLAMLISAAAAAPNPKPKPDPPAAKPDPEPPQPKPSLQVVAPAGIPAAALQPIADKWWTRKDACPSGTKLILTKRKRLSREVFCARGRTKHGPYAKLTVADDDAHVDVEALERVEYLATQGQHVDGVRQGLWTTGYLGTESSRVYYVNGKREGVELTVQDGFRDELMENYATEMQSYQHDLLDGPSERYDDDGKVVRVRFFKQDKKDGRWLLFKHGRRIEKENWDGGVANGRFARWDDDGKLVNATEVVHGTGTIIEWMWGGNKSSETAYVKGVEHGPFKRWLGGQLSEEGTHAHGELDGLVTTYRDDGSKEWQGPYRVGLRDGEWSHWTRSGRENARGVFRKDERDGVWLVDGVKLRYQKGRLLALDGRKPARDQDLAAAEAPDDE